MKKKFFLFLFLFGLLFGTITAQELPPIEVYSLDKFGGENQNWAISQSNEKYIYIANNKGLLEYNGANWTLYPSPNETILRSVNAVGKRIYTGCYMEFGYWERNSFGSLEYTSLSKQLDIPIIEDEQFWSILNLDHWILFQSLNRIIIYSIKEDSYKTIESKTRLTKIFKTGETIYFQKINDGIYKIENGVSTLITKDPIVQENIVVNVFNHQEKLLIQTEGKGFYSFKNNTLSKWDVSGNSVLSSLSVYSSIQLKDKSFAFGTISNGVIHMSSEGVINNQINQNKGLTNNTVLSLLEDIDNNIWLGLDNGINCINITSPFSIYNDEKGKIGTVYASATHNDYLYLGTNQGLFYKQKNVNEDFKFIEGTKGQVWCLVTIEDTLFCGHNAGTFIVNENQVNKISSIQGTWNLQLIEENKNLILQGNYNGLNILEKASDTWRFRNKIEGFNISSKYFERVKKNEIFVSHEYKGIFKIKVNNKFTKVLEVVKDTSVMKGLNSSLIKYNNDLLYSYKKGVYKYNESKNKFEIDTIYSKIFKNQKYTSGKLIVNKKSNKLWGFTAKGLNYFTQGKLSSFPIIKRVALSNSLRKSMNGYENILFLENKKYLFGTSTGYIIIDLEKIEDKSFNVNINTITKNSIDHSLENVPINELGEFKNKENNIGFSYNIAEFDKFDEVEYKYQLIGIYDQWSDWSTLSKKSFSNLPYNDYTFNVKARISDKESNNIASYNFTIAKPWYLTNLMIVIYILSLLVFSLLLHNIYKRYYKKQREKLLEKTERELELKKLENKQQLMSFQNEKLQQDIASKNRELAISTMSLIKKNEFLNGIKNELKNVSNSEGLNPVIKIIDKNLNNTDDWKFFQEAFNNADKDFLKKVKSIHPSLTPNDLRLCAYLRLNLSSKEIAPLLNISPRSVEVKRYRLRKKMNLEHEKSLTNYIIEL